MHLLFAAGVESVEGFRSTTRSSIYMWTTPARSDKGDIAALYGTAPMKAFVAVARQCTEAVESRIIPGQYWAWFQVQPLGVETPLAAARAARGLDDWGLLSNLAGRPEVDPGGKTGGALQAPYP